MFSCTVYAMEQWRPVCVCVCVLSAPLDSPQKMVTRFFFFLFLFSFFFVFPDSYVAYFCFRFDTYISFIPLRMFQLVLNHYPHEQWSDRIIYDGSKCVFSCDAPSSD